MSIDFIFFHYALLGRSTIVFSETILNKFQLKLNKGLTQDFKNEL